MVPTPVVSILNVPYFLISIWLSVRNNETFTVLKVN